jgi:hypothetical protein
MCGLSGSTGRPTVTLQAYIRDVLGLNFGWIIEDFGLRFSWFSLVHPLEGPYRCYLHTLQLIFIRIACTLRPIRVA